MSSEAAIAAAREQWADEEIVARVLAGDTALFEILMRRHNERVYRAVRAVLRDDAEAEDVMQDAYVRAYQHLSQFAGRARFSTWLTRIALHESYARLRRRRRTEELDAMPESASRAHQSPTADPEQQAGASQLRELLEDAVSTLPQLYRAVFVLREVQEMSTAETAECLDVSEETVKVRLHRAKALLRRNLYARAGGQAASVYPFHRQRCDRVVAGVMLRIAELARPGR